MRIRILVRTLVVVYCLDTLLQYTESRSSCFVWLLQSIFKIYNRFYHIPVFQVYNCIVRADSKYNCTCWKKGSTFNVFWAVFRQFGKYNLFHRFSFLSPFTKMYLSCTTGDRTSECIPGTHCLRPRKLTNQNFSLICKFLAFIPFDKAEFWVGRIGLAGGGDSTASASRYLC